SATAKPPRTGIFPCSPPAASAPAALRRPSSTMAASPGISRRMTCPNDSRAGASMDLLELHALAEKERAGRKPLQVRYCMAAGCASSGSESVGLQLREGVKQAGLGDRVQVCGVGCMRLCSQGPLVRVDPDGPLFEKVTAAQSPGIVAELTGGHADAQRGDPNAPFFARQA